MTKLKPYPEYKASGIDWLDEIPVTWGVVPLMSCVVESRLRNSKLLERNLLSLSYGRIVPKNIDTNDGLLPESFDSYQIVQPNDVVFRLTDLQNDKRSLRSALVGERGIITSAYLAVTPRFINPKFLAYAMRDTDHRKVFYAMGGGLRQSMNYADMRRLPTLLPSPSEQASIATFLDRETAQIDAFIADQDELIGLLAERRVSTISHAVTKGLDSSAPMADSGVVWLGEVPSHWTVRSIRTLSAVRRGASPRPIDDPIYFDDEGEWAWVRIQDVTASKGSLFGTTQRLSSLGASLSVKLAPGSLFLSIAGSVGKPCITEIPCCIHDGFVYFLGLDELLGRFLFRVFESGQPFLGLGKMGTQLNLNTDTVGGVAVVLPPVNEICQILEFLDQSLMALDSAIADAKSAIALSRERRAALISAAVTGKIDVRNAA